MEHGERLKELNPEQRRAMRDALKRDVRVLLGKVATAAVDVTAAHTGTPEGATLKTLLVSINEDTGGLLGRAAEGFLRK